MDFICSLLLYRLTKSTREYQNQQNDKSITKRKKIPWFLVQFWMRFAIKKRYLEPTLPLKNYTLRKYFFQRVRTIKSCVNKFLNQRFSICFNNQSKDLFYFIFWSSIKFEEWISVLKKLSLKYHVVINAKTKRRPIKWSSTIKNISDDLFFRLHFNYTVIFSN